MRNGVTKNDGISLTIQSAHESPNLLTNTIHLPPGTTTNIGLTIEKIVRLKAPYSSNCTDGFDYERSNETPLAYSPVRCKSSCYIKEIYKNCGCLSPIFMQGNFDFLEEQERDQRYCKVSFTSADSLCSARLFNFSNPDSPLTKCTDCRPACNSDNYQVYIYIFDLEKEKPPCTIFLFALQFLITGTKFPSVQSAPHYAGEFGLMFFNKTSSYHAYTKAAFKAIFNATGDHEESLEQADFIQSQLSRRYLRVSPAQWASSNNMTDFAVDSLLQNPGSNQSRGKSVHDSVVINDECRWHFGTCAGPFTLGGRGNFGGGPEDGICLRWAWITHHSCVSSIPYPVIEQFTR